MTVSISTALQVGLDLIAAGQQISSLVRQASAAGRETLSQEEWVAIRRIDDAAREQAEDDVAELLAPPLSPALQAPAAPAPAPEGSPVADAAGAVPGASAAAQAPPAGDPPPAS